MDNLIAKIYQYPKTVFSNKDLALIWGETRKDNLKAKIAYYVKRGALIRLSRGIYAKDKNYDPRELAASFYTPSYISFETALRDAGIIFQHYETIFAAAPWPKTITIDRHKFSFRKLKDSVLFNPAGVNNQGNYNIATAERAFLDMIYLFPNYYFDHLDSLNWEKCFDLAALYDNQQLNKRLKKYHKSRTF